MSDEQTFSILEMQQMAQSIHEAWMAALMESVPDPAMVNTIIGNYFKHSYLLMSEALSKALQNNSVEQTFEEIVENFQSDDEKDS